MQQLHFTLRLFLLLLAGTALWTGCERELDELQPATFPTNGDVFIDAFSGGLLYAAFGGSDVTAFDTDTDTKYAGTTSMRFEVPDFESPDGAYAGGAFFTEVGRDLTGYNVLSFWARASQAATIDLIGFGNDLGANQYQASVQNLAVTTNWKKYYIPIPDPSRLTQERGLFFYSEGPEDGRGYTFWVDELQFEDLGTIAHGTPTIFAGEERVVTAETGTTFQADGFTSFNLPDGVDQRVETGAAYFTYTSSDPSVATVSPTGLVTVQDTGTAKITAILGEEPASGSLTITSTGAGNGPQVAAPSPMYAAEDVISIFSNAYEDVPVDFFNGYWEFSTTETIDLAVDGNDIKRYSNLNFVGIQFTAPTIDASEMTHLRMDIWTPDSTAAPNTFKILLLDIGSDGSFGGDDDSSHEITLTAPTLRSEGWVTLEIPLTDFPGLTSRSHLAQLVMSGDLSTVFVDNVLFYRGDGSGGGGGGGQAGMPTVAAPSPGAAAEDVVSVFSDAYENVASNLNPDWGQATAVSETTIEGNNTLVYAGLNYQGLELGEAQNLSEMETFHLDVWTDNSTTLKVFLVSDGPVEQSFTIPVPTNGWSSIDIPLADFSPVDLAGVIQLKFEGDGTIYLDNLYFYRGDGGSGGSGGGGNDDMPTVAAPVPTRAAADVVSLFSDAYTDVPVDTWRTDWSSATLEDVMVAGSAVKKYTDMDFVGIEAVSQPVDASAMTYVHFDVWSPNFTQISLKLVDFGADGAFDGGDDSEQQLDFATPAQGEWVGFDIPLSDFGMLTATGHIAQLIFVAQPTGTATVYLDNVYFYREDTGGGGGGGGGDATTPDVAAPTPTAAASGVISLFSDAYTNISVDTWRTDWSSAILEDVMVAGNATKKYTELDFVGIETVANPVDASAMTHIHFDVWSPDFTLVGLKLVDFGADGAFDGGDDSEFQLNFETPAQGQWVSYDIPLADFTDLAATGHIGQLILVAQPTGEATVFLDNVYFHN